MMMATAAPPLSVTQPTVAPLLPGSKVTAGTNSKPAVRRCRITSACTSADASAFSTTATLRHTGGCPLCSGKDSL
jgi:hypothetical protein